MKKTNILFVLFLCLLEFIISCENFNPSFEDFLETSADPENKKGFLAYEIVITPSSLFSSDSGHFSLNLVPLSGGATLDLSSDWILHNNILSYKAGAHKIPYGGYKLSCRVQNPQSSLTNETTIWILPGETSIYSRSFSEADFTSNN
ncbi:MAG: hypothetical protein LBD07_04705 [Spirochaetaceae bacterium]|jgi:hypothetical protein|nr:hypothetical protein [Spirochaetaceae bacterium]